MPAHESARKPQHKARALDCGSLLPPLGRGYLQGASKLAHFHEKVGKVKNSPTWRADLFCANERKAFHCLSSTPPFHLSPLRLFRGGEKVPQLAMGLFRRQVKCRRWGRCEHGAKRFLFGAGLAATSLQPRTGTLISFTGQILG